MIRSPIDQVLIVQGGPGTGKTAVALHRAAYLLFEHRGRLARDGVLVVGPNRAFLDYIGNVLPSLGERSVRQVTVDELCIPRSRCRRRRRRDRPVEGRGRTARRARGGGAGGDRAAADDIRVPIGAGPTSSPRDLFAEWLDTAKDGHEPDQRTARARCGHRQARAAAAHRQDDSLVGGRPAQAAINASWPTQKPVRLVDRFLPGPSRQAAGVDAGRSAPRRRGELDAQRIAVHYGHVVVDEAQDHSAVALRVIGRRSPAGRSRWSATSRSRRRPPGRSGGATCSPISAPTGGRDRRRPHDRLPRAASRSSTSPTGCCR